MNPWMWCALLPMLTFPVLVIAEHRSASSLGTTSQYSHGDWVLNLSGFFMQGLVIPAAGLALATYLFPSLLPGLHHSLQIGFIGAFLLNFIVVDFLYYLQHRAFHQIPCLWKLHAPHHYSPVVNVWATSRNALVTHFFFVYMLVSPVLGYLCDVTEGFFAGAMLTAALDLFRHARVNVRCPGLDGIFVMPGEHHRHHNADKPEAKFWRQFYFVGQTLRTFEPGDMIPSSYGGSHQPSIQTQLLCPWKST